MSSIDFAAVKRLCKIDVVLRRIGWVPSEISGQQMRGSCPLHGSRGPSSRTFAVRARDGCWWCHRCKAGGSVIDLFARLMRLDVYEAARHVCHTAGVDVPYVRRRARNRRARPGTGRGTVGGCGGAAPVPDLGLPSQARPG